MSKSMSYVHKLIRTVRRDAGLTLKQVEFATHYAISTVNGWENEKGTVDPDYMARLYDLTSDLRLGQFIVPTLHRQVRPTRPTPPPIPLDQANQLLLTAIQELATSGIDLQRVLADGRVDSRDDDSLMQHDAHANRAIEAICTLRQSIAAWRTDGAKS